MLHHALAERGVALMGVGDGLVSMPMPVMAAMRRMVVALSGGGPGCGAVMTGLVVMVGAFRGRGRTLMVMMGAF
jgi:hypothetical protein